ncbi:hypothetical protein F5X96DRAFT_427838 [Biscogniauxia mediterranea]|nr:hypothetical protein F5X96DRAFT_427838 [Biscogniauxia mediterranea]
MAQEKMTLEDWLDDLCVRFIINLPREDLSSVARICFQIEEAQWFYEDFIRPLDPTLPSMSLRSFSLKMFQHCPLLASFSAESHIKAFEEFMQYKTRVPVRGAIMLNEAMDAAVLVRGYKKGASWSFPRGKINKDENDLDCAVREVYEETGYDLREAGLIEKNAPVHPLEVTMHDQQVRLYVFRGVPEETVFETRTRKEIGDIKWYKVSDLPAYRKKKGAGRNQGAVNASQDKFYMVAPFMVQLRQWVLKQKKLDAENASAISGHNHPPTYFDENLADDNIYNEPVQPPMVDSGPESLASATRELQRLLQVKPPTQGLQMPSPSRNPQAGQALMSLLQPKTTNNGHTSEIHTPLDQEPTMIPQPPTPHHHHPTQRMPLSEYDAAPPAFPIEPSTNFGHSQQNHQQHRPRPHVDISMDTTTPPSYLNPPRSLPHQSVPLMHPQPLPPQVQKNILLRDMVSSPAAQDSSVRAAPRSPPQGNYGVSGPQYQQAGAYGAQNQQRLPHQLAAHPANLLNVLKGNNLQQTSTNYQAGPQPPHGVVNVSTDHQHQQRPFPVSGDSYASQYGTSNMPSAAGLMSTNNPQAAYAPSSIRAPTDKHRAGLLGMFKQVESAVSQSQMDGQGAGVTQHQLGATMAPPQVSKAEQARQQWAKQSPSTAEALSAAARDNGRPIQMNPETNLPFGAHSILSRPQPSRGSVHSPSASVRSSHEPARNLVMRSRPSPASSLHKMSPSQSQSQSQFNWKAQQQPMGHASPQVQPSPANSYLYSVGQGNAPNPLSLVSNPPVASALPMPGMMKPRQDPSAEQKNALLSLFGKPNTEYEQGKGKEGIAASVYRSEVASRSRLASFASSGGEGAASGATGSRRGSATPLSPSHRTFLLEFLENASKAKC